MKDWYTYIYIHINILLYHEVSFIYSSNIDVISTLKVTKVYVFFFSVIFW